MWSVGRATASAASMSNELTVAAANFNLDFTLMKVEAPPEYQRLGAALSTSRRERAEVGSAHTTARKLGALFEQILPATPRLFQAYGQRASDTANSPTSNPLQGLSSGPFADHLGIDGTNIWAAATSGKRAIAVHLLACMLARILQGPEAISTWVELVERRKQQIKTEFEQNSISDMPSIMAAQQDISREHLALWDASARAWLQTCDNVHKNQQTQLRLIVNNVNYPINNHKDTYQSVIEAWVDSMTSVEGLISGVPQRVQNGAVLLALSSWHLYPDMVVLGSSIQPGNSIHSGRSSRHETSQDALQISQKDPLIEIGGILTIGLHVNQDSDSGVFWSLPLAHMRYYGTTPVASRALAFDTSRVTVDQFYQVILGCLSAHWRAQPQVVAESIITLHGAVHSDIKAEEPPFGHTYDCLEPNCWFMNLVEAAKQFTSYRGHEKQILAKLAAFGARRAQALLCRFPKNSLPAFGLTDFPLLFSLLRNDEQRIKILRQYAKRYGLKHNDIIIRYRPVTSFYNKGTLDSMFAKKSPDYFEYASAISYCRKSLKRDHTGSQCENYKHRRWIAGYPLTRQEKYSPNPLEVGFCACRCRFARKPCENDFDCPCCLDRNHPCSRKYPLSSDEDKTKAKIELDKSVKDRGQLATEKEVEYRKRAETKQEEEERKLDAERKGILADLLDIRRAFFESIGEIPFQVEKEDIQEKMSLQVGQEGGAKESTEKSAPSYHSPFDPVRLQWREFGSESILVAKPDAKISKPNASNSVGLNSDYDIDAWDKEKFTYFEFLLGDENTAALFIRRDVNVERHAPSHQATLSDVTQALSENSILSVELDKHLAQWGAPPPSPEHPDGAIKRSLKAMSAVKELYSNLAEATVALEVINYPLYDTQWALTWSKSQDMDLSTAFSCIMLFESGRFDIQPKRLARVMAMAVGNSIYIGGVLVNDPTNIKAQKQIKRVVGNLGRAGMVLLIAPNEPKVKPLEYDRWNLVNHADFDGEMHDSFQNTTLHLSFTEFQMPLDVIGAQGIRDTEVSMLESVVSVHNRGEWIGDLNVLSLLPDESDNGRVLSHISYQCSHSPQERAFRKSGVMSPIISLDSWNEFLDRPIGNETTIFRGHGNWVARLAAAAISVQMGLPTFTLSDDVCWKCCEDILAKQWAGKSMLIG
ncbi:uncharacterized protein BP5553_09090 [Venustampulla echinocandica]|uniref:Uncharacterized protein n=1 Tax=Venustampulla echinocandica TaxID=2656787 RepID=A0A370TDV3_9HELO|nr:uncharacterized protein BP5553_09090 [Venustampulla echinocandica]RDL32634.1 hypothetical protein BP5553_09090 [Venustampulla echinocandica]